MKFFRKKTPVRCRGCGWDGKVALAARHTSDKGVPSTSVPCPKCGEHKLRRII